jgi:hypothetical protein
VLKFKKATSEIFFCCSLNNITAVALNHVWCDENHAFSRLDEHEKMSKNALQGNCMSDPEPRDLGLSGPDDLVSGRLQQCVLVTDTAFLRAEQNLWLDNLYIRFISTDRIQQSSIVDCFGLACNLWLTSVTMQGADDRLMRVPGEGSVVKKIGTEIGALAVVGGQLYAEGVCFPISLSASRVVHIRNLRWVFEILETLCGT